MFKDFSRISAETAINLITVNVNIHKINNISAKMTPARRTLLG